MRRGLGPPPDGDEAHCRHVHAEATTRRGDERDLHRDGDEPEAARLEPAPEENLDAERGRDADDEPGDVRGRPRQERAFLAYADARSPLPAIPGNRGRAGVLRRGALPPSL